ncbi:hypothetical protein F5I97DRAFT_232141 [Phlebopus sp. FC_14]|nr:hypothetical protein F5I97DRAFT_232141 [Phlebopus sp. FC_14]
MIGVHTVGTFAPSQSLPPHRPLRERCQVRLTVNTVFSGTEDLLTYTCEPREDNTSRYRANKASPLPPREENTHALALSFNAGPLNYLNEKSHMEEIVPGLYVAFADDDFEADALRTFDYTRFSHVVQVMRARNATRRSEEAVDPITGTCKLRLSCPAYGHDDRHTALKFPQLLAARDFMSLALPYQKHPSRLRHVSHGDVNLLVVAPTARTVDIMSIVVCYLAFISARHANCVLEYIDEVEEFDETWKGESLTAYGAHFVEYVATHD